MSRKVVVFTSTRADWGQLRGLAAQIRSNDDMDLSLLVSGSHLSAKFGSTISEVEQDGFDINEKVDILLFDDSRMGVCKSMGEALAGYAGALTRMNPDVLIVLGDRYETFCVATAAHILRIPLAHIHGGEKTAGAIDEAFRHSISKMAQLHFPSCEEYRNRLVQLGERPECIFNFGALALENIRQMHLMTKNELSLSIDFPLSAPYFLVTFHPATLEDSSSEQQLDELISSLGNFTDHRVIFTKANADADGQKINAKLDLLALNNPDKIKICHSLGLRRYLSAIRFADAVIGNSSSGILEAPMLNVPTVNIGDRQNGRLRTVSVIDCEVSERAITAAIKMALDEKFRSAIKDVVHPCDQADTAKNIATTIRNVHLNGIVKKQFYDLPGEPWKASA